MTDTGGLILALTAFLFIGFALGNGATNWAWRREEKRNAKSSH